LDTPLWLNCHQVFIISGFYYYRGIVDFLEKKLTTTNNNKHQTANDAKSQGFTSEKKNIVFIIFGSWDPIINKLMVIIQSINASRVFPATGNSRDMVG